MKPGQALLLFTATLAVAIPLCILFSDQPVALFCHQFTAYKRLFQVCAAPSLLALPGAGLYLIWAVWRHLRGRAPGPRLWLAMSLATMAATAAKDELKWVFGRPWPGTWMKYGIYQFHPFTVSLFFGAFPSGHTAYISAPLGVLWVLRPHLRWLWGGVIGLVMAGLVAANYHFLGDVLGGLLTGTLCAWGTLVLMGGAGAPWASSGGYGRDGNASPAQPRARG